MTASIPNRSGIGIQRACLHRIANVARLLRRPIVTAASIHQARTDLKAAEALLTILRPQLRLTTYRQSRRALKEVRQGLGTIRDLAVNTEELARATRRAGLSKRSIQATVGSWGRQHRKLARGTAFAEMTAKLESVRHEWITHPPGVGRHLLRNGLRRLYRRAAASCRCAAAEPTSHHLHECRQRTQRLRYALEFAAPWLPERKRRLWHRTKVLGTRLGRHRDLGRLARSIDLLPIQPSHRRSLHAEIEKRRTAALRGFLTSVGKTYSKKCRRFNGLKKATKTEKRASE